MRCFGDDMWGMMKCVSLEWDQFGQSVAVHNKETARLLLQLKHVTPAPSEDRLDTFRNQIRIIL